MAFDGKLTFETRSAFHTDVKARVESYFRDRGISKGANAAMVAKTVFWMGLAWGAWALIIAQVTTWPVNLLLFVAQGFGLACIGFNVGHDAIHGGYVKSPRVNKLLSFSFDFMGASSFTWALSHNHVHHTYTNVIGVDGDLEPGPWMSFYPSSRRWFHRWQHIYAWFFYCLTGVVWVLTKDFEQALRVDPRTGRSTSAKDWALLILGKVLHIGLFLVLPLVVIPGPWWHVALGYLLLQCTAGLTLATVFQLAHCTEGTVYPEAPASGRISEPWAEHQMRTTANFGNTWLATFITGGLDHQIEHHLFPRICHIHYRALAPIVRACAADHGVPYIHNGSFPQAVLAHARTLRRIGRGEPLPVAGAATRIDAQAHEPLAAAAE